MPITKSAKKALRQALKRRKGNLAYKKTLKNLVKEAKALFSQNKKEEAKKLLPKIYKALDKAAKAGVIKKNTASRRKSRLAVLLQSSSKKMA